MDGYSKANLGFCFLFFVWCCYTFALEIILVQSAHQKAVHFRLLTSKKIGLLLFKKKSHPHSGLQKKIETH